MKKCPIERLKEELEDEIQLAHFRGWMLKDEDYIVPTEYIKERVSKILGEKQMIFDEEERQLLIYFAKKWTQCSSWFIPEGESCGIENCEYHNKGKSDETYS